MALNIIAIHVLCSTSACRLFYFKSCYTCAYERTVPNSCKRAGLLVIPPLALRTMGGVPQSCRRTRVGLYRFSFVTHENVSENPRNSEKIMLRTLLICFNIHRTQHQQQWLECLSLLLRRQRRSTVRYFQCTTRKEPAWSFLREGEAKNTSKSTSHSL